MEQIILRFKSGKEYRFQCESYTIETFSMSGNLANFSYKGGVGECPVYFKTEDIESIGVYSKGVDEK